MFKENISRREFLKLAALAAGTLVLSSCDRMVGLGDNPEGIDMTTSGYLAEIEAYLAAQENLYPDLQPFSNLDWLLENPEIIYGMRQVTADEVESGEAQVRTTNKGRLYFRLYWTMDNIQPNVDSKALPYITQGLLVHEMRHFYNWWNLWQELKRQGFSGNDLSGKFEEKFPTLAVNNADELSAQWSLDLYDLTLVQDPEVADILRKTYFFDPQQQLYDKLKILSWLVEQGLDWRSFEYKWHYERDIFTTIQATNQLNGWLGEEQIPYPVLTVRDSQVRSDFLEFMTSSQGAGLIYNPGEVTYKNINGHMKWTSRDMFETNPLISQYLGQQPSNYYFSPLTADLARSRLQKECAKVAPIAVDPNSIFAARSVRVEL